MKREISPSFATRTSSRSSTSNSTASPPSSFAITSTERPSAIAWKSVPLSFREAAQLIAKIAKAVDYAHKSGIIHRDIKPSNIMIDSDGNPRLMDFGLAKRETIDNTVTSGHAILGTPAYMSPEQAWGGKRARSTGGPIFIRSARCSINF